MPAAELDLAVAAYRRLKAAKPDWLTNTVVGNVLTELKRAKREAAKNAARKAKHANSFERNHKRPSICQPARFGELVW